MEISPTVLFICTLFGTWRESSLEFKQEHTINNFMAVWQFHTYITPLFKCRILFSYLSVFSLPNTMFIECGAQ